MHQLEEGGSQAPGSPAYELERKNERGSEILRKQDQFWSVVKIGDGGEEWGGRGGNAEHQWEFGENRDPLPDIV